MDLASLLVAAAVALLLAKFGIALSLFGIARRMGHQGGSSIVRILAKTMLVIAVGQMIVLAQTVVIEVAADQNQILLPIGLEAVAQVILLAAFVWAWWSLVHLD